MMNGNSTLNGRWSENELATIKNVIQGDLQTVMKKEI